MPNPDLNQDPKKYVQKEFEQVEEEEGPVGIHVHEEVELSRANANANSGGSGDLSGGLSNLSSSNDGELTAVSKTDSGSDAELGGNSESIEETASGDLGSEEKTTADTPRDEGDAPLEGGMAKTDEEGLGAGAGNEGELGAGPSNAEQKEAVDGLAAAGNTTSEPKEAAEAKALLQGLIEEAHVTEGRPAAATNDGELGKDPNGGSGELGKDPNAGSGQLGKETTTTTTTSSTTTTTAASGGAENSAETDAMLAKFSGQLDPEKKNEKAAVIDEQAIADQNAGREAGLQVGRSMGFGQLIITAAGGETTIKAFTEGGYTDASDYSQKQYTALTTGKSPKFIAGYNMGYNSGYVEGGRMKNEVAARKQQQREQDPNYADGKRLGIEAGTKSISKEAADKARADELRQAADGWKSDPNAAPGADPSPEALKNKGFYAGYNQGVVEARKAEIAAKKAADTALLANPEYREGYDFGHRLAMNGMSAEEQTRRNELMNQKDANGQPTMLSKGVAAGFNKGYGDAIKAQKALRAQQEEALKHDDHFGMGSAVGTMAAALRLEGFDGDLEETAMKILSEELSMTKFLTNPIPVTLEVKALFSQKRLHKTPMTPEQKAKYSRGYYTQYNKATVAFKQKMQAQKDTVDKGSDAYTRGDGLGKVAGSAASIRDELRKKLNALAAARLQADAKNETPGSEETALIDKIALIDSNITKIRIAVDANPEALYRRGYFEAFNKSYSKENSERVKAKDAKRKNEKGTTANEQGNSKFQQGLTVGRKMGEMVFNLRRLPLAERPTNLDDRITAAFKMADDQKEPDFKRGFLQGYNEKVMTGSKEKKAPETLKGEAFTKSKELDSAALKSFKNKKEVLAYFREQQKEAEEEWFEYNKLPEDKRPAKSPQFEYDKLIKDKDKLLTEEIKDFLEEKKIPVTSSNTEDYLKAYKDGYELGAHLGKSYGDNYLKGYKDAINNTKGENTGARYSEGYSAGKGEAQYKNFSGGILAALGLDKGEGAEAKRLKELDNYTALGRNTHYNNWLAIFLLQKGIALPDALKQVDVDLLKALENPDNKKTGEPAVILTAYENAIAALGQKDHIADAMAEKPDGILYTTLSAKVETEMGASLEGEDKKMLVKKELTKQKPKYLAGYKMAIAEAEKKANESATDEANRSKGFVVGYAQSAATFPSGHPTADMSALIALVKANQEPEELYKSTVYQTAKTKGYLLGMQVKSGFVNPQTVFAEMQSPAYRNGYKLGETTGVAKGKEFLQNLLGATDAEVNVIAAEDNDARKNLTEEGKEGFDAAYKIAYNKARAYSSGYISGMKKGMEGVENAYEWTTMAEDDAIFGNYQQDPKLQQEFQLGFLEGRNKGLIANVSNGKGAETILRNAELQRMLEKMKDAKGKAYVETFKKARNAGITRGKAMEQADRINESARTANEGIEGMSGIVGEGIGTLLKSYVNDKMKEAVLAEKTMAPIVAKYKAFSDFKTPIAASTSTKTEGEKPKTAEKPKETLAKLIKAMEAVFAAFKPDAAEKEAIKKLKEDCENLSEAYEEGYWEGIPEGIRQKKADEYKVTSKGVGATFFEQMLAAINNKAQPYYVKGFSDAAKQIRDMNRKGAQPTSEKMEESKYKIVLHLRKRLRESIEEEYKDFVKNAPDRKNKEAYDAYKEHRNNYRNLLTEFKDLTEIDFQSNANITEFVDGQLANMNKELKAVFEKMPTGSKAFFEKKLEGPWKKTMELYRKGFETSFPIAIQDALDKRSGIDTAASGSEAFLDYLHDLIEAGKVKDGVISDIDWLEKQDELRHQIYETRAAIDMDELTIYDTKDVIFDLKDEVNVAKIKLQEKQKKGEITEDDSLLETLGLEIEASKKINDKEADLKIASEAIDEKTEKVQQFLRDKLKFDAPKNTNAALRQYLLAEESRLEIEGTFNDKDGNAEIEKSGSLTIIDKEERWKYKGEILLNLGDMKLKASGLEVFDHEYYVQLRAGEIQVPIVKSGKKNLESFAYSLLDFEMGIGMLEQIDQQLNLGDQLQAGSQLGDFSLGGGSGGATDTMA